MKNIENRTSEPENEFESAKKRMKEMEEKTEGKFLLETIGAIGQDIKKITNPEVKTEIINRFLAVTKEMAGGFYEEKTLGKISEGTFAKTVEQMSELHQLVTEALGMLDKKAA